MLPERTAQAFGPGVTAASRSVLLELMVVLRAYREALVLVGGWVPFVLLERHRRPDDRFVHVGSIDIDLAVDPRRVNEPEYATIVELLRERGYRPAATRRGRAIPNSFERTVHSPVTAKPYAIRVDFLTPFAAAESGRSAQAPLQDELVARKIKGCEAAFRYQTTVEIAGALPDGGRMTVPIHMADLVASLTMKGIVLGERYREKDAYDIYALVAHYGRGPAEAAHATRPHLDDPLVSEGMVGIRSAFATRDAHGPAWVASFLVNPMFVEERERVVTDAYMVVSAFGDLLFAGRTAGVHGTT